MLIEYDQFVTDALAQFFGKGFTADIINTLFWAHQPMLPITDPIELLIDPEYNMYQFMFNQYRIEGESCFEVVV